MKRIRLRVVLPAVVLAVTVGLLVWAHVEEQEFWRPNPSKPDGTDGWDLVMAWDYMPAGRILALNLNFPIALLYQPLHPYLRDHTQMGPPPWEYQIPFLIAVPILWYWPGRGLDRYRGLLPYNPRSPRGPVLSVFAWLGLLACLFFVGILVLAHKTGYVPILTFTLGIFFWSLGLSIYFLRQLLRRPFRLRAGTAA